MDILPATATVRDIRNSPNEIFKASENGPVMIMSKATPRAVVISPAHWNSIARQLQRAEAVSEIYAARARRIDGKEPTYTLDEVIEGIRERHGDDVADRILDRSE